MIAGADPESLAALGRMRLSDRQWGEHTAAPSVITSGRWQAEVRGDEIAELRFDGTRIARAVRLVARDPDWRTVPATVDGRADDPAGCTLALTVTGFGVELAAELKLIMDGGRCRVELIATAQRDLQVNRVGLVLLHPPELAGIGLDVGSTSGATVHTCFPVAVAPWQPAQDIERLRWVHDGVRVTAVFAGDVFEMEDQRNWTDASFKTYSRPLELPFPYRLGAGEVVEQSVIFDAVREGPRAGRVPNDVIELAETGRTVPAITVGASRSPDAGAGPIPAGVAVLVELDLGDDGWPDVLTYAVAEAGGSALDLRLIDDDPDRITAAVRVIADDTLHPEPVADKVSRIGAYSARTHVTEPRLWSALSAAVAADLPAAELVGGSRAHYTELNRTHHRLPELPALTFAITPQMHTGESRQLVESIGMQAALLADADRIADGRPVHVGPITLRPRFNDVATGDLTSPAGDATISDPRQAAPALEPWTIASFAAICGGGADVGSVCYFEVAGARGLGTVDNPFPVARAVATIAGMRGRKLLRPVTAAPPDWWLVGGAAADGSVRLLAASLADDDHSATVRFAGGEHRLSLSPYQVADLTLA